MNRETEQQQRGGKSSWFQLEPAPSPHLSLHLKFIAVKVGPLEEAWCHLGQSKARQRDPDDPPSLNNTDAPPNWGKISADRWVASFQSMPSDMIRAGGLVGDRATIKAVVRVQAQDGLTIAASFLEQAGETQAELDRDCKLQNKLSSAIVTHTTDWQIHFPEYARILQIF